MLLRFYKEYLLFLFLLSTIPLCGAYDLHSIRFSKYADGIGQMALAGKVTFRVDMRNETVAPSGVYFASSFMSTIGGSNWSFVPMCDLGGGIWEISFVNVPAGQFQYKFVNGIAPADWEFTGYGGPCTNPADNNNRFVTITGGIQSEGPFCFGECNLYCSGLPDPGNDDVMPPIIIDPVPADLTISCSDPIPAAEALDADDGCDFNATTTTGMPTQTIVNGPCNSKEITRTWTVTDCSGNQTIATQLITVVDLDPPLVSAPNPPTVNVNCGNLPAMASRPASDACDVTLTSTGMPVDMVSGVGPCGGGSITRIWTATDCAGNTTTVSQVFNITDNAPPSITGMVPANITVTCDNVPQGSTLDATDACDINVSTTDFSSDNNSGLNSCGIGQIIRTWEVSDCSGNTATAAQTITVVDTQAPTLTVPANTTVACSNIPPAGSANTAASDNCTTSPTITYVGETIVGSGCQYQLHRTWRATDCAGNSATKSQVITVQNAAAPIFAAAPSDVTVCQGNTPAMMSLSWTGNCSTSGMVAGTDASNGMTNPEIITRTWSYNDGCGTVASASQKITVQQPPLANAGTDQTVCGASSVTLSATVANGFSTAQWTSSGSGTFSGGNTANATYTPSAADVTNGLANLTFTAATSGGACPQASDMLMVTFVALPQADAGMAQTITCNAPSVQIGSNASTNGFQYQWSGPGINAGNQGLPNPSVGLPGTYNLTVTELGSTKQCTATSTVVVSENKTTPTANAGADKLIGCTQNTVALDGNVSMGASILWSGPGINASNANLAMPNVGQGGQYILTATHPVSGCLAADTVVVAQDGNLPVANAGADQTLDCQTTSVVLNGGGSASGAGIVYQWMDPSGNALGTAITQAATMSGTYTLRVSNTTNGCSSVATVQVINNNVAPMADAGADATITCANGQVTLGGNSSQGPNFTYQWSLSNGTVLGNNAAYSTSVAENYILRVLNTANGCSATDNVVVTSNTFNPIADAGPDKTLSCSAPSVLLDGTGSSTGTEIQYNWSGNGFMSNQVSPSVTTAGVYVLQILNTQNACSATDTVVVVADAGVPTADAGVDATITCLVASAQLGGTSSQGAGITYNWANASGTSVGTDPQLNVNQAGNYTLTVFNTANGCSATDVVSVMVDNALPTANAGADKMLSCTAPSVLLDGSGSSSGANLTYQWSAPGFSSIDLSPTVSAAGTYVLVVTNTENGCSATDNVIVSADAGLPTANAGADETLNCLVNSVTLNAQNSSQGTDFSYEWQDANGNTLGNGLTLNVNTGGTFNFIVNNTANGCFATDMVTVTQDVALPVADAGQDQTINCTSPSLTIGGNSSTGANITYQWSGNGVNATTINLNVSTAGTYELLVTNNQNGCTATDAVTVAGDATLPTANAGQDQSLTCTAPTVTLGGNSSTGNNIAYLWSGNGVNATTINLTVSTAGTYQLLVTNNQNGCTATDAVTVAGDTTLPTANAGQDNTINCLTTSVLLDGANSSTGNNIAYAWSGGGFVSSQISPAVTVAGTYTLLVTNTINGCTATDMVTVTADVALPIADAGPDDKLDCLNGQVTLGGASSQGNNITYNWEDSNGNAFGNTATIEVVQGSTYSITVLNTQNGCSATDEVVVIEDLSMPEQIFFTAVSPQCDALEKGAITVDSFPGAGVSLMYALNGGVLVDNPAFSGLDTGTYTLTVQNLAGCTADTTFKIEPAQSFSLTLPGDQTIEKGDSVLLVVNASSTDLTYIWSDAASLSCGGCANPTAFPDATTTYTLTAINALGCTATGSVKVEVVVADVFYYIPNVFSPGSANGNDRFTIYGNAQITSINTFQVFDRWGALVFTKENFPPNAPAEGWDGTAKGKKVNPGIYSFWAELQLGNGETQLINGDVLLSK